MCPKFPFTFLGTLSVVVFALIGCTELTAHRMDDPSRDVWQKPQGVVEKLSIAPGSRVADVGAGEGSLYVASGQGGRSKRNGVCR